MGVKDLWNILSPTCEKKPVSELQGKCIAIDLSAWVCDSHNLADVANTRNMYLRNLFFRTCYLLLLGVKPIFILEGNAPEMKHKVMENRKAAQYGTRIDSNHKMGNRSRLNSLQRQCEELLNNMGLTCFRSRGEAEALCAYLNKNEVVDGIISQDSDNFLYGAKKVYRNFSISSHGSGTVEEYDISKIEQKLSLGRDKLIALSLLCGCDYNEKGVPGVGKETAMKFLRSVLESEILHRLQSWCNNSYHVTNTGDVTSKIEASIRQKALLDSRFPFQDIQDEFLLYKHDISNISFKWKQPNIQGFVIFCERKLGWNANYALEKFLPIVSRWHLLYDQLPSGSGILLADRILKKRQLRGVTSFEVKWKDFDICTIEPHHVLQKKYLYLIDEYETTKQNLKVKNKKVAQEKRKQKKKPIPCDISKHFDTLTISDNILETLTISDNILETNEIGTFLDNNTEVNKNCVIDLCGYMDKEYYEDQSLTTSDFECSATDLLELSTIVESIVRRKS